VLLCCCVGDVTGLPTYTCSGLCPAGRYGSTVGLMTSNCTGVCVPTAGKYCGPGSNQQSGILCPAGQYSNTGSTLACDPCPPGKWCLEGVAVVQNCSTGRYSLGNASQCTSCPAGTFGNTSSLATAACSGLCTAVAGRICNAGATTSNGSACPVGRYSDGTLLQCNLCPAGRYGNATQLPSSDCTAPCVFVAGRYCGEGATSPSGMNCSLGQYGTNGLCLPCPAGRYGKTTGL
jgi:hypothetical protein